MILDINYSSQGLYCLGKGHDLEGGGGNGGVFGICTLGL